MVCLEYEDLLVGYSALEGNQREHVDAHLQECMGCRAHLLLLSALDASFSDAFAGIQAPVAFRRSLIKRLEAETMPSPLPVVLDLFAGVVLIIVMGLVLSRAVSEPYLLQTAVVMLFALSLWMGLLSYSELREDD